MNMILFTSHGQKRVQALVVRDERLNLMKGMGKVAEDIFRTKFARTQTLLIMIPSRPHPDAAPLMASNLIQPIMSLSPTSISYRLPVSSISSLRLQACRRLVGTGTRVEPRTQLDAKKSNHDGASSVTKISFEFKLYDILVFHERQNLTRPNCLS